MLPVARNVPVLGSKSSAVAVVNPVAPTPPVSSTSVSERGDAAKLLRADIMTDIQFGGGVALAPPTHANPPLMGS